MRPGAVGELCSGSAVEPQLCRVTHGVQVTHGQEHAASQVIANQRYYRVALPRKLFRLPVLFGFRPVNRTCSLCGLSTVKFNVCTLDVLKGLHHRPAWATLTLGSWSGPRTWSLVLLTSVLFLQIQTGPLRRTLLGSQFWLRTGSKCLQF